MKTLGLIGGMSWESTSIYYRVLNEGAKKRLGELHSARILLWSFDFADIAVLQAAGDWAALTSLMMDAARKLKNAGAEALVICTNTMHKMVDEIGQKVDLPLIHIVDATAAAAKTASCRRPALLATRYTMEQDFYKGRFRERHGIELAIPEEESRALIHHIIYEELCRGIIHFSSKQACLDIVRHMLNQGADSVIFGCTEIGMLLSQADFNVPVFDTASIHAHAALDFALTS